MKRWIVWAMLLVALGMNAQEVKPERIPWIVERAESAEWYENQIKAWEKVVANEPANENAWYNLSRATRYATMDTPEGYEKRKLLNERMRKAIPNTYTYHFCAYDTMNDSVSQAHIERAYQLMPANRTFGEEYGTFIAYFWQKGRDKELKEMGRKYYEEQQIPTALLRYNYNELQCLPPNALYIGLGDAILLPKIALQQGLGVHQDKVVICASFLYLPEYYQCVCRELGIEPETFSMADYQTTDTWENYLPDRIEYIMKKSGRPTYFSPSSLSEDSGLSRLKKNLYNEGLVLRYSDIPYDNYVRVRENVERNIRLDYLIEPQFVAEKEWQSANALTYNYFVLLAPLIGKYREWHDVERSEWLANLLTKALEQAKMSDAMKNNCQKYLNINIGE